MEETTNNNRPIVDLGPLSKIVARLDALNDKEDRERLSIKEMRGYAAKQAEANEKQERLHASLGEGLRPGKLDMSTTHQSVKSFLEANNTRQDNRLLRLLGVEKNPYSISKGELPRLKGLWEEKGLAISASNQKAQVADKALVGKLVEGARKTEEAISHQIGRYDAELRKLDNKLGKILPNHALVGPRGLEGLEKRAMGLIRDGRVSVEGAKAVLGVWVDITELRMVAQKKNTALVKKMKANAAAFGSARDKLGNGQKNVQEKNIIDTFQIEKITNTQRPAGPFVDLGPLSKAVGRLDAMDRLQDREWQSIKEAGAHIVKQAETNKKNEKLHASLGDGLRAGRLDPKKANPSIKSFLEAKNTRQENRLLRLLGVKKNPYSISKGELPRLKGLWEARGRLVSGASQKAHKEDMAILEGRMEGNRKREMAITLLYTLFQRENGYAKDQLYKTLPNYGLDWRLSVKDQEKQIMGLISGNKLGKAEAIAVAEARMQVARLNMVAEKGTPILAKWKEKEATSFGNVRDKLVIGQKNDQGHKLKR